MRVSMSAVSFVPHLDVFFLNPKCVLFLSKIFLTLLENVDLCMPNRNLKRFYVV